jgi:hypothetical protein
VPERRQTTAAKGKKQRPWRKREAAWRLPVCPSEMAGVEDPKESIACVNPLRICPQRGGRFRTTKSGGTHKVPDCTAAKPTKTT